MDSRLEKPASGWKMVYSDTLLNDLKERYGLGSDNYKKIIGNLAIIALTQAMADSNYRGVDTNLLLRDSHPAKYLLQEYFQTNSENAIHFCQQTQMYALFVSHFSQLGTNTDLEKCVGNMINFNFDLDPIFSSS